MDFNKLTNKERIDFLILNNRDLSYDISLLFNELVERNSNTFTIPVVDLYIASKLTSQQKYSRTDIINHSQEFANLFNIPNDISRILRILNYANLIIFNIGELIRLIEDSVFYYQIITDKLVDSYVTCEVLQGHELDDFVGFQAQGYQVDREGLQQFLNLSLTSDDYTCDGDYLDLPATSDNIRESFVDHPGLISFDGKIMIPKSFKDSIYADDDWIDDVEFRFVKVSDPRLLQYII